MLHTRLWQDVLGLSGSGPGGHSERCPGKAWNRGGWVQAQFRMPSSDDETAVTSCGYRFRAVFPFGSPLMKRPTSGLGEYRHLATLYFATEDRGAADLTESKQGA